MIEGLSLPALTSVVSILGLPGMVLLFWYSDQRRYERERKERIERDAERDAQFTAATTAHERRFEAVVRMYEDNVLLVKGYERMAGELTNVILLNTQVNTKLVERIDNNLFCPIVKEGGRS